MRRRNVRSVREEERPTLLLMAAGAVAGAAAGLYLGRRYRSFDAFMDDVRDRLGDLRTIWYDDELAAEDRGVRIADALDEFEEDEGAEEFEDEDEDEDDLDDQAGYREAYAHSEDDVEDEFEDDGDDVEEEEEEEFDDEVDELEEELAAVTASNGSVGISRSADKARKLEERVLDALHDDTVLSERAIEIAVVGDGVVELTGTVRAIEEVSRASAMVRSVPGVSMVLNRIDVSAGGTMDTASVPREPTEAPGDDRATPS
jgi:cobalamin biosynthesis protein CobT